MGEVEISLSEEDFVSEVRDALAGIGSTQIPEETIIQSRDRLVEPMLNDLLNPSLNQDHIDNAGIYWSAELAFTAWMTFSRLRDREIEAYVNPDGYREQLIERTDRALFVLDVRRPPKIPNQVVTVKHDGKKRRVNLDQEWVPV